jgi:GT2 family glycosyltransferase
LSKGAPPPEIVAAARRRSEAREAQDWATADLLRAEIEAAGWRVVDSGTSSRLEALHPPEVVDGGIVRYGRSDAVPSRLAEPDDGFATVVIVGEADAGEVVRALDAARRTAPTGVSFVVVANGMASAAEAEVERGCAAVGEQGSRARPGDDAAAKPPGGSFELVRTSARLGRATALNIGLRRARGAIVVLLDPGVEAQGDIVTPLARALDDPTVAVAGPLGFGSTDLRRFDEVVAPGPGPVTAAAIEGALMAFRRSDAAARGPLDEQLQVARNLDVWWSLVLRDEGEGVAPRRALVLPELPLGRHEPAVATPARKAEAERLAKRSFYRVMDRFGRRPDLAIPAD